mmetsp:Transcript_35535/g.86527  ORF Transcript_35535/g.86527 Transcript_35535/m.86527 type:complete len:103 (-) Transcript_35535:1107-1415(-)
MRPRIEEVLGTALVEHKLEDLRGGQDSGFKVAARRVLGQAELTSQAHRDTLAQAQAVYSKAETQASTSTNARTCVLPLRAACCPQASPSAFAIMRISLPHFS